MHAYTFFLFFLITTLHSGLDIRHAQESDLESIMALDREISWEHFKSLFLEYQGLPLAENPDALLEEDLLNDRKMFIEGINQQQNNYLYVATDTGRVIGFIALSKEETNLAINLIFVHKDYRNKKIGKRLLETALSLFSDTITCSLIVLDKNTQARKFYESYGFIQKELPEPLKQLYSPEYAHIYIFYELPLSKNHGERQAVRFGQNSLEMYDL